MMKDSAVPTMALTAATVRIKRCMDLSCPVEPVETAITFLTRKGTSVVVSDPHEGKSVAAGDQFSLYAP